MKLMHKESYNQKKHGPREGVESKSDPSDLPDPDSVPALGSKIASHFSKVSAGLSIHLLKLFQAGF